MRGSVVYLVRLRVDQPDPSGLQVEQFGHQRQRARQRLLHIRRAIQRLRNRVQNHQFPGLFMFQCSHG